MRVPAKPKNENQRLLALHKLEILDTVPEERFDRISTIAQNLFDVPIVLITLVDEERQWFKSCVGLDVRETSREISFCGHAILGEQLFEVADATQDPRFADNPLVTGAPGIRFYAGMPVSALDGSKLGTLCLIDNRPRQLNDGQRKMLKDLAVLVEEQLNHDEMRQLARELSHASVTDKAGYRARVEIRKIVDSRLQPLIVDLGATLEVLGDEQLDRLIGDQQLSIREAVLQLQAVSDDLKDVVSLEGRGLLEEVRESGDNQATHDPAGGESPDPGDFTDSVLIVDDEPFVLKVTAHALESMGFAHVVNAESGQRALDLLSSTTPDVRLALVDLNMPDMDGIELLRRFDEVGYSGDILLFSGEDNQTLSMAEGLAKARRLSVLGSIGKPVQPKRLLELLAGRRGPSPRRAKSSQASHVTPAMLEAAIDAGSLEPWFQPKIDIATRQPVGVEMLARWPNGPRGPVYPDEFIPVAESSGLIDRLTFMLIAKTVVAERAWRAQGLQLKVAVNLSMESLQSLDFPQRLEAVVEEAGGSLGSIQLEVTESSLMEDLVASLDVLLRLRLKKVRLSIDDFGTGHSNLSQLRDLPFDELKLDRSYVRGEGERSRAILESSVEIAKKIGMSIVAEGVETLEDWRLVEKLGCDQVQGWFCAKAMPENEIAEWVGSWEQTRENLFSR
ncbi:MAG: EAL domain-containing protein [Candidatus Thiodiazotropha taylori]|nr:EAL domain-containing protein [Candidatus Thiodiazotropha taylori]